MLVAVVCDGQMLVESGLVAGQGIEIVHVLVLADLKVKPDAIFYLQDEAHLTGHIAHLEAFNCLVIVNAIIETLDKLPPHFCRVNAWPGFLQRSIWEVAARQADVKKLTSLFHLLNKKVSFVSDQPGMIAARIIAMIVNEAFFALQGGVSTEAEIDMAMKLGTNYPLGPFEWCHKIGAARISALLKRLEEKDPLYQPAPMLI